MQSDVGEEEEITTSSSHLYADDTKIYLSVNPGDLWAVRGSPDLHG